VEVFKILANRQLAEYSGSDKYINISKNTTFQNIFTSILNSDIKSINNKSIRQENKGQTKNLHFEIEDIILKKSYNVFFAKGSRELRLQLTKYVDSRKIIPGDLITVIIDINNQNCNIKIKSESLYRYMLERKSKKEDMYRIFTEYPQGQNNAGVTTSTYTSDYLKNFNIKNLNMLSRFGKSEIKFTTYSSKGCKLDYIGIPHNKDLQIDCFNDIKDIV
jgi:hypothetical protein